MYKLQAFGYVFVKAISAYNKKVVQIHTSANSFYSPDSFSVARNIDVVCRCLLKIMFCKKHSKKTVYKGAVQKLLKILQETWTKFYKIN